MREVLGTPNKLSDSEAMDMKREISKPKYDWPRHSLMVSVQSVTGLCTLTRKCIRKDGHANDCWPKEK